MFDAISTQLLQSAPGVPGLDPQEIPMLLTGHYAALVSQRLSSSQDGNIEDDGPWTLERIADTYELITSLHADGKLKRAAAFVAGTAQQILSRKHVLSATGTLGYPNIDRDRVDPTLAAAVLFLAAEQYADANEAASSIVTHRESQLHEATVLSAAIAHLAKGQLQEILDLGQRWRRRIDGRDLETQALAALLETLIVGLEMLSAEMLAIHAPAQVAGRFASAQAAFLRVLSLSAQRGQGQGAGNTYGGPHHLASLLLSAHEGLADAALTALPPPDGADPDFWRKWLSFRASKFPFVWPNHRQAIAQGFHQTGKSAVVVLPTGAGKTTISSLKIAGVLARRKKVVFLAPTHALVEQLTEDLQEMFPEEVLGSVVSSDFDLVLEDETQFKEIEVMTPERCLAMLSFSPDAFADVGLLVFDECHLLSPKSGKVRRALDGMLCLLSFNKFAPDSDMLLMSAMLKDAGEFSEWIAHLTTRDCVCVDLLWKPSRQARGVLIYRKDDLKSAVQAAVASQKQDDTRKGKRAKTLRASAKTALSARPWAIWGLEHNWLGQNTASCAITPLLDDPVPLAGEKEYGGISLKPNANKVAARVATGAATRGLKSIVFVNTKDAAVSVASEIAKSLGRVVQPTKLERERWDALATELGDLRYSLLKGPAGAVPHNSLMIRLERDLAERMFKRPDGADVIVATPTLAQGLNLPAQLAILAGDKRGSDARKGRENLETHEILNAAARAGRAGHLANGVVILVPEPLIDFDDDKPLDGAVIKKLESILPKDDRCIAIRDPLELMLDRLDDRKEMDQDVIYTVNRMAAMMEAEGMDGAASLFDLKKSLGAFSARRRRTEAEFDAKITQLKAAIERDKPPGVDRAIAILASQSGLPMAILVALKNRVLVATGSLPTTIEGWLLWTLQWLAHDESARLALLHDVRRAVLGSCGANKDGQVTPRELALIQPGLLAWISGHCVADIERALGGNPDSHVESDRVCPRARELIGGFIPRGMSFVMGLVAHVVQEVDPFDAQEDLDRQLVECIGTAVRKGYDLPEKLFFAADNPRILSRVQVHNRWSQDATIV